MVSIVESSSRREERARMEGLTPPQQQYEGQDNLVGGPGLTQSGGGATGSVQEGTMHGNTLVAVNASSSRSVQCPEVESQARGGDHRWSGRRSTRISPDREGRSSVRHHQEQTNTPNMSHPRNATKPFPERNLGAPHRRVGGVRISRRQGRGGITASWRFLTGHHRRPGDR